MTAFAGLVDQLFADPNLGRDAIYEPADGEPSPSASSPGGPTPSPSSAARGSGRRRRGSTCASREVANPRPGDRIVLDGEAFVVQGEPVRDRERLVWTLDVRPE